MFNPNYIFDKYEKPLDRICEDGGLCGIFRTIACVGDSLSSGEFELYTNDGQVHYNDMFEYSWGQYIARTIGSKVYNFSRGGMTTKEYCESFAEANDMWNPEKKAQAYIIALGMNDINWYGLEIGSVNDIHPENPEENADTFAGWYGRVISKYKEIAPDAKFFLVSFVGGDTERNKKAEDMLALLNDMARLFSNTYVIDLYNNMPAYDGELADFMFYNGHLNPAGYLLTGKLIASYIDYIVRHNYKDFKLVGYINTELSESIINKIPKAEPKTE